MQNYLKTALQGFLIGSADVVPGVSGGTMALVLGIYSRLLQAIMSVNIKSIKLLLKLRWKEAFSIIDLKFLLPLMGGIGIALIAMSRVLRFLIEFYPHQIWSVFFGFVLSSAVTLFIAIKAKKWHSYAGFLLGAVAGYAIVGLAPVEPEITTTYLFLSGFIAIIAMILPGISGSFILVVLGSYFYVLGCITDPFNINSMISLAVFGCGALLGITGFSRVLNYALSKANNLIMALMTGIMIGSLRKIWPWKSIETIGEGKHTFKLETNIVPPELDSGFWSASALCIAALLIGWWLAAKSGGTANNNMAKG